MKKVRIVILTEDEYNDLRLSIKEALDEAEKFSNNYPSYTTGRIWGRLHEAWAILNKKEG